MASAMSKKDLEASHKKSLKTLEGEKRAAMKKAKGMKGKKGKEELKKVEYEFMEKFKLLEMSHEERFAALEIDSTRLLTDETMIKETNKATLTEQPLEDKDKMARERKIAKAKRKRDKQKEKEARIQREIEEGNRTVDTSLRQIELEKIEAVLRPLNLKISEVEADGHCLYRALAAQLGREMDFRSIRKVFELTLCIYSQILPLRFCQLPSLIPYFTILWSHTGTKSRKNMRRLSVEAQR